MAKPGMTTDVIDEAVHKSLIAAGAYPSPLNYVGFPKSVCTSINEVICHGIPDTRPLQFGDIVSFDVSCFIGGVHGDNCATVIVGDEQEQDVVGTDWRGVPYLEPNSYKFESPEQEAMIRSSRRLVHATRESMYAAIDRIGPGRCLTDVGAAIQDVADSYGYSTVEKYRGHGIGSGMKLVFRLGLFQRLLIARRKCNIVFCNFHVAFPPHFPFVFRSHFFKNSIVHHL
jgi:methionyl aminopeptidase